MFLIKLDTPASMPTRANPTDAGLDLRVKTNTVLYRNVRTLVPTGVKVKIPVNFVGLLFPRSSLSKLDVIMTNSVGVIDSDYRGEIMASLQYNGKEDNIQLNAGDRIVQLVLVPIITPNPIVLNCSEEEWIDTARGAGGFGSTGKE